MTHLYELSKELAAINDELINAAGEVSPDLELRLNQVNLALTEKATGIRKWLAMIETDGAGLDAEIARLQKMRRTNEHLFERLKTYVYQNMIVADKQKIETPIGTFTVCKSPPKLELIDEAVPDSFKTEVPAHREITAEDKKRIKAAIEEGYEVSGARLVTDNTHLRIK